MWSRPNIRDAVRRTGSEMSSGGSSGEQRALKENNAESCPITVGIRPEHISLCSPNDPEPHFNAVVDVCEMMGSSMHLHVNMDGKDLVIVLQTVDLPADKRAGFAYGEEIGFRFDSELMHMFDAKTDENLI